MKYVSISDKDKVKIHYSNDTVTKVSNKEILKGWKHPASGLWRVPLAPKVKI